MELGLDFDDTDFVEKVKEKQTLTSYNAKVCYPKWFLDVKADNGKNDAATLYKFKGDYHYLHKNIQSAIDCYKHSLECLCSHNRTMRRELVDSLARCYIQIKEYTSAKQFVDQVFTECLTTDNWCQALLLKQQLLCASEDYIEEVKVLHQLITVFSGNSEFWIKLSDVYRKILKRTEQANVKAVDNISDKPCIPIDGCDKGVDNTVLHNNELIIDPTVEHELNVKIQDTSNTCSESIKSLHIKEPTCDTVTGTSKHIEEPVCNTVIGTSQHIEKPAYETVKETSQHVSLSNTEYMEITSGYPLDLILLTCLVRARLVFCGVQVTVEAFVKDRNIKCVEKLSQQIDELSKNEIDIERATQYLRKDMHEDESADSEDKQLQGQDAKAMMERQVTCAEFNQRWFSWIKTEQKSCSIQH